MDFLPCFFTTNFKCDPRETSWWLEVVVAFHTCWFQIPGFQIAWACCWLFSLQTQSVTIEWPLKVLCGCFFCTCKKLHCGNSVVYCCADFVESIYITIYIYLYIPGTCLSSILVVEQLNPPKQGLFQWKQGLGSRFIHITVDCRMFQQMVHVMSWSVSFMCLTQAQCCKTADGSLKVLIWAYLGQVRSN